MVALFCCFQGSWKINRRKGSVEKERWKKNYRDYNRIDKYYLETQRVPL